MVQNFAEDVWPFVFASDNAVEFSNTSNIIGKIENTPKFSINSFRMINLQVWAQKSVFLCTKIEKQKYFSSFNMKY